MPDIAPAKIERLHGILSTLVRLDLGDVKDAYTREKIITARDLSLELLREYFAALDAARKAKEAA